MDWGSPAGWQLALWQCVIGRVGTSNSDWDACSGKGFSWVILVITIVGMETGLRLGFIGAGKMGTALARGLVRANILGPEQIIAGDPDARAREAFAREVGGIATADNGEVVNRARVIVLAVKPQLVVSVLESVKGRFTSEHLVVSLAAGVPIARLEGVLGERQRIIRVMPNTPVFVGAGVTAFAPNAAALLQDVQLVEKLFSAVGMTVQVHESLMDVVTGLSGSGPAYVYMFIEALSDGAVAMGMPRDVALKMAAQTVLGSARMVLESGVHPGALKDAVASPGGTTIAGIHELEKGAFRADVMSAVIAATRRARELSGG